uniref:Uncharacterized protein n=1 Tax=uncultured marine virus TaxID=186617 RepID=A0A0F7L8S4_9VIRU|nr:hypothetical protein RCAP_rcc00961 [uncultured marine virus]
MAQTLKFGNGTWATKKGSTLAYSDTNNSFKPLPFTYTGAGKGTRVNKEGLIEVVENDRPRIDYLDSEDGVFLLEKAATNLLTYSEDFINSYWSKVRIETPYIADVLSPDGTLNVNTLEISNGETNGGGVYAVNISLSGENSFSVFAKKKTANYLVLSDSGTTTNAVYFDLENGIVGTTYNATGEIQDFGNGWYRCTMKYTLTSSGLKFIYLSNVDGLTNGGVVGGDSIYIYGAQIESGNVSSYIPTQGTIQTRVQETASGSGNSEVFNSEEGILYAEGSLINDDGTPNNITLGDNTFSNNRMMLLFSNGISNRISARFDSIGSDVTLNADGYDLTLNHKVVLKYKANDIAIWVDGFEIESGDFSFSAPSLLNRIDFYNPFGGGQNNFYGKTKEIAYYDEVLTDLELETLTSYRTWEEMVKELNLNIIHNE